MYQYVPYSSAIATCAGLCIMPAIDILPANRRCFVINGYQNIFIFFVTVGFAVLVTAFHTRVLASARRLVMEDKEVYDRLWGEIVRDPVALAGLVELRHKVELASAFKDAATLAAGPLQYSPQLLASLQRDAKRVRDRRSVSQVLVDNLVTLERRLSRAAASVIHIPASLDLRRMYAGARVSSLDQLFAQARCLQPLLIRKVEEWALKSGGCVFVVRSRETGAVGASHKYARYSEVKNDASGGAVVRLSWVKAHHLNVTQICGHSY